MSVQELPALRGRLDAARSRVRRMLPRALLVMLGISMVGISLTWVLELAGAVDAAGIVAAVLVVLWVAAGAVVLLVVVVLVAAAASSGALGFAAMVVRKSNSERGE